jgi:hypothetical protein
LRLPGLVRQPLYWQFAAGSAWLMTVGWLAGSFGGPWSTLGPGAVAVVYTVVAVVVGRRQARARRRALAEVLDSWDEVRRAPEPPPPGG